jgi:hypothetical protein
MPFNASGTAWPHVRHRGKASARAASARPMNSRCRRRDPTPADGKASCIAQGGQWK